ncbi:MAG: DUF2125 domain-containing protein, partial [Pseudomonadota bacterium]
PVSIEIREIRAIWGELDLAIAGDLRLDDRGRAEGEVLVKARAWQDLVAFAEETGLLPGSVADTVEGALTVVAGLAGRSDTLDVPLTFRRGRMFLGPVAIGEAPTLRLP